MISRQADIYTCVAIRSNFLITPHAVNFLPNAMMAELDAELLVATYTTYNIFSEASECEMCKTRWYPVQ